MPGWTSCVTDQGSMYCSGCIVKKVRGISSEGIALYGKACLQKAEKTLKEVMFHVVDPPTNVDCLFVH